MLRVKQYDDIKKNTNSRYKGVMPVIKLSMLNLV